MSSIKVIRRLDVRAVIATKYRFSFFLSFSFSAGIFREFYIYIYFYVCARVCVCSKRERRKLNLTRRTRMLRESRVSPRERGARGFREIVGTREEDSRTDLPAIRLKVVDFKYRVPRDVIVTLRKSGCLIQLNGKRLYFH